MTHFLTIKRLDRQVLHLEHALEGTTSRLDLIMEKLGFHGNLPGTEVLLKTASVSADIKIEYTQTPNT